MADRNFFRLAVDLNIDLVVAGFPAPLPSTLLDISEGGCKVSSASMILKGSQLSFSVPRNGMAPIKLRGTIAHVDYKPVSSRFEYGVQYTGLRPADADAIAQFITQEQRRKLQTDRPAAKAAAAADSGGRNNTLRVERKFPIQYAVFGQRTFNPATATDVSRSGMRVVIDQRVPEGRTLELRFTLPDDVLGVLTKRTQARDTSLFGREITVKEHQARPFPELRLQVKLLPGWHEIRESIHYSTQFVRPNAEMLEEIERFLHAAQLTQLHEKRRSERTVYH